MHTICMYVGRISVTVTGFFLFSGSKNSLVLDFRFLETVSEGGRGVREGEE